MDISDNMDSLDDSSALPELSFDDLLDASPIKKTNKSSFDDDALELDNERKNRTDDTLNTPGPKKPPTMQKTLNTSIAISSGTKTLTPVRTHAVKLGNSPSTFTQVVKNNGGNTTTTNTTPVLLNTKNVLPKTATQIPTNSSIKLTPKIVGGNTGTGNITMAGKTAVRTSNGQIIYIQKTPTAGNIKAAGGSTTTIGKTPALGGNNSKPVTIQVLRTADGSYVPIKTTTAGTNGKNTTLTLSPTSLAGKKIISSAGGQVIIKGTIKPTEATGTVTSMAKTMTTNALTGVRTVVKPMTATSSASGQVNDLNKSKPIVVQASGGKQIIVSNQNIVKLSPKPHTVTTTAGAGTLNTSTTGSGQIHAIQIPGKIGVQYVRVLPNTKVPGKSLNTSSPAAVTSTATAATKTVNTTTSTNQPVKILNSLPQKFTLVQKAGTKLVVTQKKDPSSGSNTDFSPMTSKVQKTIVTVPTIKSLNEDKNKNSPVQQQQSLIKNTSANLINSNNSTSNQTIIRKHKISEINTEIQRITTATDNAGPPEIKKPTPNNRVVVVSSQSQPKILNNSIQQPGRITLPSTALSSNNASSSSSSGNSGMVKITQVTQNGNKLYTVLKPSSIDQKANPKPYSVLKTNNQTTSATAASSSSANNTTTNKAAGIAKPLINKQQLLQQQQKLLQLKKQQQQSASTQNTTKPSIAIASSSGYIVPIQIKEEPADSNSTTASNIESSAAQHNLPTPAVTEEENDSLDPMVGGVRRKHCNCSKSQCLKLYCDCFANGEFCQDCTCKDCFNNLENEDERQRAIKTCLERNPNAFKPKITSSRDQADMRLHNKGCNCKRSGCLKNYCECYEAKIPCSSNCKCVGCRNVEDRPDLDMDPIDPKIMATIAMGGSNADSMSLKRSYDKTQRDFSGSLPGISIKAEKKESKSFSNYDTGAVSPTLEGQQCNFITQEVIDATIQCMITQADECEKNNLPAYQTEKMVMEELGRCLVEIIDFSIRTSDNSYSQD
ncbi:protein lin-54 homolog [Lucilia sericata]|uniref:protein lin-54 homolog n=1 Tax=Lucilia sericata TaxID=13632 RepID=UPI0018A87C55|nr:protein lin-54 homolog [Lucilia sericata]